MKKLFIIYFAILHILILSKSDFFGKISNYFNQSSTIEVRVKPTFYERMLEQHIFMDIHHPDNSFIFIGDSIIQGLSTVAIVNPSINYGISADTTSGVLNRIQKYNSLKNSHSIIIHIGINDILMNIDIEKILLNYQEIISTLQFGNNVYISAIFPVATFHPNSMEINQKVTLINENIENFLKTNENFIFIDNEALVSDDSLYLIDGVHLSPDGYKIWIETLRRIISK